MKFGHCTGKWLYGMQGGWKPIFKNITHWWLSHIRARFLKLLPMHIRVRLLISLTLPPPHCSAHCTIHTAQSTLHNAVLSQEFHSPHTDSARTHCSAVHIRNRGSLVHGNQTVPSTRKYKIKDPSEDKNGNDFRFWEAQGDTIWWKIVLHRPHSTYVKNVGQIFIFWISLLALTQGFQLPFMCFICTCTSHRLHQAGTIRGETSKPDLIQNSILKVHMLRFFT